MTGTTRILEPQLYIDIHSHILPGVDDGPPTSDISLKMIRRAAASGIKALVATPHIMERPTPTREKNLLAVFHSLCRTVIEEQIDIDLYLGSELLFQFGIDNLVDRPFGTYRVMGNYFLVETAMTQYPAHFEQSIFNLIARGKKPIFAHPERIQPIVGNAERVVSLVQNGFLTAVSSGSLLGSFGRRVQSFAWELLDLGIVHIVASDAHDTVDRTFNLDVTWEAITERYDEDTAEILLTKNPLHVLFGEPVERIHTGR